MVNMRQAGTAMLLRAADNNGWLNGINVAYTNQTPTGTNLPTSWTVELTNYIRSAANWRGEPLLVAGVDTASPNPTGSGCPKVVIPYYDPDRPPYAGYVEGWWPYGANTCFVGNGYDIYGMHSLNEVVHRSRIFLLIESYTPWPWSPTHVSISAFGTWGSGVWVRPRHPVKGRDSVNWIGTSSHPGCGLNCVFVDGHAEFLLSQGDQYWQAPWYASTPGGSPKLWYPYSVWGYDIWAE